MKRSGFLKRTPFSDRALPVSGKPRTRTHASDPIPQKVRAAVKERSGGLCEDGCGRQASHVHHRKLRSQGGEHTLENTLHLSSVCHAAYHLNPTRGYLVGALVKSYDDPAEFPFIGGQDAANPQELL